MKTEAKKEIIGVGVLIETKNGKYVFQKRDENAKVNPKRIAPFGGGLRQNEDFVPALIREIKEELNLDISADKIKPLGIFESHAHKDKFIKMYLVKNVDFAKLELKEGEGIAEITLKQALKNPEVTDFTKEVICHFSRKK